jgi:DNA-binding CsgD family transcriptional regulator
MPRVSGSDYRKVLDVLYEAGAVEGTVPFPDPVLHSLRQLVPCDVVTYHAQPGGGTPAIARAGEWCRDWTPQMREVDARTWHQDGLTPTWGARKVSDNLSRREFRRLELYDVSRLLGIEFMMRLWLDPDGADGARLEFDREEKDFDERDRAVLDLLLPHLARLRRQAAGRARDRASEAEQLTAREREILGLVAKGRTNVEVAKLLWIPPGTVRKHLENAYEKLGVHTRTAAVAAAFGRREDD